MRKAWSTLAIVAIVSTPAPARAQSHEPAPLSLELAWDVPATCPDAERVRLRIGQILRRTETKPTGAVARGRIETLPAGRFRMFMSVRTEDAEDVRKVDAASCGTLAEAFAVVVALAIDPTLNPTKEAEPEEPAPPEQPSAPVEPAPPSMIMRRAQSQASLPANITGPPLRADFGLGAFVAWGPLPDMSTGPILSLGGRIGRFRFGALAAIAFRQRAFFSESGGATFDMIEAGAFGSYLVPVGPFAVGPSASIEAVHVTARGFGIREPWETSATWPAPAIGARVEATGTKWLGLFASADMLLPIDAPNFSLATTTGEQPVRLHSPGRPSPRLSLGAELLFP